MKELSLQPTDPNQLSRTQYETLHAFVDSALEEVAPTRNMTKAQSLSLLVGLAGLRHGDVDKTYTLVYTDEDTGKSNYQTACAPRYASQAPFHFNINQKDSTAELYPVGDPSLSQTVRLHAVIEAATNHHYSRVDSNFNEVPTAVIASPRSACAAGCSGCSRGAIDSFTKPPKEYIKDHVQTLRNEYDARGWNPEDLISVNITTGSQPTEEKEVDMMVSIMDMYRRFGFTGVRFMIYNYALRSREAMQTVRDAGADGYIGTIETMNDDLRRQYWGRVKGGQTFDEHLRRYEQAHEIGFPIVETNYVVGLDPYDEMMEGIERLDANQVAVVPNVKRSYNTIQFDFTHSDVWKMGFGYVTEAFDRCLDTYSHHPTIKAFAGRATVKWLQRQGKARGIVTYHDLPIRHT